MAAAKAAKATQKWARTSLLAWNTAHHLSAARPGEKLVRFDDLHACPHGLMTGTAILVTRHEVLPRFLERSGERRHEAGHQHHVGIGRSDDEAMNRVGTRSPKGDRHLRRHDDAL